MEGGVEGAFIMPSVCGWFLFDVAPSKGLQSPTDMREIGRTALLIYKAKLPSLAELSGSPPRPSVPPLDPPL